MTEQTVLRRLEPVELMVNRSPSSPNTFRTIRVSSRDLDLFSHLDQLKTAIQTWKQTQPLLRATVAHKGSTDDDFFFVIDENSRANKTLENVHFIRVNSSSADPALAKILLDDEVLIELVLEKCAFELIDFEKNPNELLWRLLVVEMKREAGEFVYELIFHVNHIVADGVSMSKNLPLLLDIIWRTLTSRAVETKDFGLFVGRMKLFEKEQNLADAKKEEMTAPAVRKPEFIDSAKARENSKTRFTHYFTKWSDDELDRFEMVDLNAGKPFVKLTELIRLSRDVSNFKRKKFDISEAAFQKFFKKCKTENVKLTSALNMLEAATFFRLCKIHNTRMDAFFNLIPVSLRQFRPEISSFQFGNCVGGFYTLIANQLDNPNDDSELREKFWALAREQSAMLEDRVKNDVSKFALPKPPPGFLEEMAKDRNRIVFHMSLSNIGVVDDSSYECFVKNNGPFRIDNMYASCNYKDVGMDVFLVTSFFATVGKKLCCSLANNSFFFDPAIADEFADVFTNFVGILSE